MISRNTLTDNKTIKSALLNLFIGKGYEMLSRKELSNSKNIPVRYVLERASYKSIYSHSTSSDFLLVNYEKNLRLRIEVKFQKHSGSVDEKLPYFYLNAVLPNSDDILFIVEGDGFKKGAKLWLENKVETEWLNIHGKKLYYKNFASSLKLLEEIL